MTTSQQDFVLNFWAPNIIIINTMKNINVSEYYTDVPTYGVSTLSWWWGFSVPETLRAMLAVA
jgi:hypothetical protein